MNDEMDADLLQEALEVDLTDASLYLTERPERVWKAMRQLGRPIRSRGFRDHWAITSYRQVEEAYRHWQLLSSEKGMHLGEKPTDQRAGEAAGGLSLLVTDDPAHSEMRKAMAAGFNPTMIRRLTESTLDLARRLVRQAATGHTLDFVAAVAAPLPAMVMCNLLGVPASDRERVMKLTMTAFGGGGQATATAQLAAHAELFGYCDWLLTAKRRARGDDVATALANATMYGKPMPREIAIMNCHDLIAGGNETARHSSGAAALSMVAHGHAWSALRDGTTDPETATEDILRLEAPVSHVMRVVKQDLEIGGVTMRKGEFVTLWLRSANRDEAIFGQPDELLFTRKPNRHLTFGLGGHYCIAAFLARIEISSVVRALLETVARAELGGEPERLASNFFRGYKKIPLVLTPR